MMLKRVVRKWFRGARARLWDAERRFFDGTRWGGRWEGETLVIPPDYFARDPVRGHLERWLAGRERLDLRLLEEEWRAVDGQRDPRLFYRNIAQFLALVQG